MMMNKKQSYGFSLVELLVAMVVGLVIISGAFSLHSGTRGTQKKNEAQMDMVADARFAIEMISYDLRHAGMWGGTNKPGLIGCKSTDAICTQTSGGEILPTAMTGDCTVGWYYDITRPIFATDDSAGNPYPVTCIPVSQGYLAGTDVLEIKYADPSVPVTLLANQAYVRSNFNDGHIFIGDGSTTQPVLSSYDTSALTQNHELHAFVYYISDHTDAAGDGIPSLRRATLVNAPTLQHQTLISGVTNMQVKIGEDLNGDLVIDRYVDPDVVTDWSQVYAAKIWLLMRSDERQLGTDTSRSFSIAGAAPVTFGGKDDYRYFMVTSVVNLRNLKQL